MSAPDSPEQILLDLPRRRISAVHFHQGEMTRAYASQAVKVADVALQLPTGSGKTLVGLLIAEWRRRKFGERVVYLCPTRQLVNQVVEQANEQYGLSVNGFTGSKNTYEATNWAQFTSAERVAVTTYSSLFNTNPAFQPEVVLLDDAHAAENYIAGLWTLQVDRDESSHGTLHAALLNFLEGIIAPIDHARISGERDGITDRTWVDKITSPKLAEIGPELCALVDEHVGDTALKYPWSMIRDHLHACHLYYSPQTILVRPLIPPSWTHAPFAQATQRIYMSATLGASGDLERMTGCSPILRLPIPQGWDRQGVGRRLFIFPGMSLAEADSGALQGDLMRRAGRSLVLVPSDARRAALAAFVEKTLAYPVFNAEAIELSKKPFLEKPNAVAVIANRYDGIDFPGDDCRLLFVEGLPKATNLQERFLMSRMGAAVLFNERVQTRVLQAVGRCTRSLEDRSAVVVTDEELTDYLVDPRRRGYLHPELQAELKFGIEQSKDTTGKGLLENLDIFLRNDTEWEEVNQEIVADRGRLTQHPLPAAEELARAVSHELAYQARLWQKDPEGALEQAEAVLAELNASQLRGYRALWHYLAGSAAELGAKEGVERLAAKAREHFAQAKEAAPSVPWLVSLARHLPSGAEADKVPRVRLHQIERVEAVLAKLGVSHDRAYTRREKEILAGIAAAENFEQAQVKLGELLGFEAGKEESDGSPDPWWLADDLCLVFEDHAGAESDSALAVGKARQATSHKEWIRMKVPAARDARIQSVLVTPVTRVKEGAVPHSTEVVVWPLEEFRAWANDALAAVRTLRRTFYEPGDLAWRAEALEVFVREGIAADVLFTHLQSRPATKILTPVK